MQFFADLVSDPFLYINSHRNVLVFNLTHKVDNPYSVTSLIRTPIFELYVISCGSKNGNQEDMFFKRVLDCMLKICYHPMLNSQHYWEWPI